VCRHGVLSRTTYPVAHPFAINGTTVFSETTAARKPAGRIAQNARKRSGTNTASHHRRAGTAQTSTKKETVDARTAANVICRPSHGPTNTSVVSSSCPDTARTPTRTPMDTTKSAVATRMTSRRDRLTDAAFGGGEARSSVTR